jgi:hypothetical protein
MLCLCEPLKQGKNQTHLVQERSAMTRNRSRLAATFADIPSLTYAARRMNKSGLKFALSIVNNSLVTNSLLFKAVVTDATDHA